ncbi:uncharacterized protein ACA1_363130 [Acanthamoeba castellanii str. Neff]|uniref:Uncharacterized protein n=1 Tax=Acanthamoeba castellanii (strain ATCC 30010 / Neff) TaxID=1257118 RepID=L8GFF4_ACACF|nr:uncharacterized protein ACA1_363130 [Acanthamoeba castellanii str. Neff]ELR11815.1 hypothetical protein ACA1_363130 [Acanthamoeba castellanii str. Neff]
MLGALDCGADTRACLRPDLHQYHADIHGRIASLADCGTHATTSMGHEYVLAVTCVQHIVSALEQDQGSTSPPPGVVDCLAVVARRPLRPGELMCPTSLEQRLRPPTGYDLVARSAALIERHHTLGEPGWRKSLFIICLTMLGVFESMQRLSDAEAWAADDDDDDQDPFTLRDRLKDEGSQAFAAVARLLGLSWCDSNEDGEDGATNNDKMSWPRACINKFLASGDPTASVLQCRLSATKWFQFRSETLATLP